MTKISNLGYPRLGENREWKKLIESYWSQKISQQELFAGAKALRTDFLKKQLNAGLDLIPVGDFSFMITFWTCLCSSILFLSALLKK